LWAAAEANSLGHGGVAAVSKATRIAESTIRIGKHVIATNISVKKADGIRRVRKKGGGRKLLVTKDKEATHIIARFLLSTIWSSSCKPS
jgi:hypothetical protein